MRIRIRENQEQKIEFLGDESDSDSSSPISPNVYPNLNQICENPYTVFDIRIPVTWFWLLHC